LGEIPIIGSNIDVRPMYHPLDNIKALRNKKSAFGQFGCNNFDETLNLIQLEEIFPDLHAIYPPPYTLEFQ